MSNNQSPLYPSRRNALAMIAAGSAAAVYPQLVRGQQVSKRQLNILFLICDQFRPDALSSYGDPYAITPTLDSLAKAGVSFRQTYCQVPICVGSRNCMLTGRYARSTGVVTNGFLANRSQVSYAQYLRSKGYITACFGKLHTPGREAQDWDILKTSQPGFHVSRTAKEELLPMVLHTNSKLRLGAPSPLPETATEEWAAVQDTCNFLRQQHSRPWMVHCSLVRPHPPFQPPARYWNMIDRSKLQIPGKRYPAHDLSDANPRYMKEMRKRGLIDLSDDQIRDGMQGYYGNLAFADHMLGVVLKQLKDSGQQENTLVIFTSDHGEMLDDHRLWTKMTFFDSAVRIPLIMYLPEVISGGHETKALVEHIDLFPTMMELLGFETPSSVQGRSFLSLARGKKAAHRDRVYSEFPNNPMFLPNGSYNPTRMLYDGRYKVIDNGSSIDPELYDLHNDPLEITNLCHDPTQQQRLNSTLTELRIWGARDVVPLQPRNSGNRADL